MAGPEPIIIPNDWGSVQDAISSLSRILNENTLLTDYILADGSRVFTATGAGFKDEDNMSSNSAVAVASQQSIKAYADAIAASIYSFKTITGITNDVVADLAADTLTLSSANARLTIVGTTATDTITFTVDTDLHNYSWTSVNATDLKTGSVTQAYDAGLSSLAGLTYVSASFVKMTAADTYALRTIGETADDLEGTIEHDNLSGFVSNEHINHTGVTITTTTPLSGGGNISANRTFALGGLSTIGTANYIVGANNAGDAWEYKQLIEGDNITITHAANSVTITAAAGGGVGDMLKSTYDINEDGIVDKAESIRDFDTAEPIGLPDGYIGSAYVAANGRLYFWVNDMRYYINGTAVAETGYPMGLLLSLTYN